MTCICDMHGRAGAHCRRCCLTFSGVWAFDRHLTLRGEHKIPSEIGLVEVRPGVWGKPADSSARSFIDRKRAEA